MQQLTLAGTIGKDAEIRRTQSGEAVAGFSVAIDNGKDKQGNKRETTWIDCSLWGKRGEALGPFLTKGSRVAITGRPTVREHNGKAYLGCSVDQVTLLGGGQKQDQGAGYGGNYQEPPAQGGGAPAGGYEGGDIPFSPIWWA